jgi:hypothetical protein
MPLYRPLAPPAQYPVEALGPVLAPAARAIAGQAQCAIACAANSVLAVASLAAQGRADAVLPIGPRGKRTPLSLYLATVLESGERKSTADTFALKPVKDFERELAEAAGAERHAWEAQMSARETTVKELSKELKRNRAALEKALHDLGPPPQPPLLPVIAPGGDQTFEGMYRVYEQGRPSLGMLCDDGGSFLGGFSLRAENKVGTTANLCRLWDGSRLERIRGGDGVSILYDRRLACHLMFQRDLAADFLADRRFADQGLLGRFLLAAPASLDGTTARLRSENPADELQATAEAARDLAAYNVAIGRLLRAPIRWKMDDDRAAGVELDALLLSDDAHVLYIKFYNSVMKAMGPGKEFEGIKPFAAKLAEHAVRIAGVLTLIADDRATEIDAATLADAITIAQFHADEALRLTDAASIALSLRQAEQLLRWLHSRSGDLIGLVTVYQVGQPKCLRSAKAAREAMQILVEHGWAHPMPDGAEIDGKRHREAWRIVRETAL